MAASCTILSIGPHELHPEGDDSLPAYDDISSKISQLTSPHMLQLGEQWLPIHMALGAPPATAPLGFLAGGGEALPSLADGDRSSGRYFNPPATQNIAKALADVARSFRPSVVRQLFARGSRSDLDTRASFVELYEFVLKVASSGRGLIVHVFH